MKIFLLGLPGSGKTTLGLELSRALQLTFVDLDTEIEKVAGKQIKDIFIEEGEQHFRQIESEELKKWCGKQQSFVMATGGGAPRYFDNMDWIIKSGLSIFLNVPINEIARRMESSASGERPLMSNLQGEALRQQLETLRQDRIQFYSRATISLNGDSIPIDEIVSALAIKKGNQK